MYQPLSAADVEANHQRQPLVNALPGEPVPYYLQDGEGLRFEHNGALWTVIARSEDTGGSFDAAYILGRRGTHQPLHTLDAFQRTYVVVDGLVKVWHQGADGALVSRLLVKGDSVSIAPGQPFAFEMQKHLSKLLFFSAPGGALNEVIAQGLATEKKIYAAGQVAEPMPALEATSLDGIPGVLPAGQESYSLNRQEGDAFLWPDAINTYISRGKNTGGLYCAVDTLAAPQPYIIRHFHHKHTENFFCLSGRIVLWVNGQEVLLTEGDFVHAPAGTIHSFAIEGNNTRMLGILTTDIFEDFFAVTGSQTDDEVFTPGLIDPATIPAAMKANPDLDVTVVGPPPERKLFLP